MKVKAKAAKFICSRLGHTWIFPSSFSRAVCSRCGKVEHR